MCLGLRHSQLLKRGYLFLWGLPQFEFVCFRSLNFFGFVFRFLPNSSTTLNRTCIQLHETTCFRMTSLVRPCLRKHDRTFETYTLLSFFALPTFLKVCLWPSNRSSARRRSGLDLLQILECYMARPYTVFLKTHRLWSWGSLLAATGFRTLLSSAFPDNLENRQSTLQAYLRIALADCHFVVFVDLENLEWARASPEHCELLHSRQDDRSHFSSCIRCCDWLRGRVLNSTCTSVFACLHVASL